MRRSRATTTRTSSPRSSARGSRWAFATWNPARSCAAATTRTSRRWRPRPDRGVSRGRGGGPRPRGKAGRLAGVAPRETHSRGAAGPRNAAAGFLDTPGRESYGMGDAAGRAVRRTRVEGQMATSGTTQTRTTPPVLNATQMERYARQLILEEVGIRGQARLLRAKVLAIGAGGLGSPVALYLAAAGVGTIGIVDGDRVDLSNLHRQILHTTQAVGQDKTVSAQRTLAGVNPEVTVVPYQTVLTSANALDIIREYDVVVNGSDNFPTRYLVNDACVLLGKPLVDASILKWEAQATTFLPGRGCYRCLFPTPPPPGAVPSCAEGGILGALCGFAGARQALEVLKIVLGVGETLANKLLIFDALEGETRVVRWSRSPECPICGTIRPSTSSSTTSSFAACRPTIGARRRSDRSPRSPPRRPRPCSPTGPCS